MPSHTAQLNQTMGSHLLRTIRRRIVAQLTARHPTSGPGCGEWTLLLRANFERRKGCWEVGRD